MITKLLISPLLETRLNSINLTLATQNLKKDHPDVLWMDDEKLGVEQVKKIREFLSLKPYSARGRAIVVLNAHKFTHDAQNALLKTLEEPPVDAIILLAADSDKTFLPTVLSRVQTVILNSHSVTLSGSEGYKKNDTGRVVTDKYQQDIEKLCTHSIEDRFTYIEKLEEKEEFLISFVAYFRNELITYHSLRNTNFAKELIHAEEWKQANGNIRAILEYLMLLMPSK